MLLNKPIATEYSQSRFHITAVASAVIESWFSTVKSEEAERFDSYAHAKEVLFDYIEVFHNQRRRHSTLGQISAAKFERRAAHAA